MLEFEIKSGEIIISDPCYTKGTWCQATIPAANGKWLAEVERINEGFSQNRNAILIAYHAQSLLNNSKLREELRSRYTTNAPMEHVFGVDSGQLGYFDVDIYDIDSTITSTLGDEEDYWTRENKRWYGSCCHQTSETTERWGVINGGVVSSSGWGDGSYATYGVKDKDGIYIALMTVFIDESDDSDFEEEDDDIEETNFTEE